MIAARIVEQEGSLLTIDPVANLGLRRELPGLAAAFDGDMMRVVICEALAGAGSRIDSCQPGRATYLPGEGATVRYRLRMGSAAGRADPGLDTVAASGSDERIVCARVFPDPAMSRRYVDERLAPLASRAAGRPETAPFEAIVAHVEPLAIALSVFPVDGDLPMLVDATDPERMLRVLSAMVGETFGGCRVDVVAYPRRGRCVLRYRLDPGDRTFYGKITAGGEGALTAEVVEGLRPLVAVPRCLGYDPGLRLVLMEPLEGQPGISRLLRGEGQHGATLPEQLARAAVTGGALHTSGLGLGADRTFESEISSLRGQLGAIRRHAPELGNQLDLWLDRAEKIAWASIPLPRGLAHGDFTHSQIVFDHRGRPGLLDFDDFCQAEPALDLGQFTAYLSLGVARAGAQPPLPLPQVFMAAYTEATGIEPEPLADRHAAYEICSFVRMAVHAWHKLKGVRLGHVLLSLSQARGAP